VLTRAKSNFNVTAREAAKQLGVHVETVKRWARTEKVPARKDFSGVWLFSQDDLDVIAVHEVRDAS
jgi:excisionase family DNA binding protein